MALDLTAEQKATGQANFQRVVGKLAEDGRLNRREFMQGLIGAGTVLPLTAAAYFGYGRDASYRTMRGNPIKAAIIGCGDEGGVLVSEHDPEYVQIVSVCDIRPTNKARIFDGEGIESRRKGLKYYYGNDAAKNITAVDDYRTILADRNIEMVIIALPLNLHHKVTMDALEAGKHVLCEKLMAWNITQCKDMIREADDKGKLLSIGHQRHYSMLYAHANEVMQSGVLGDVRHIRALWHRNNTTTRPVAGQTEPAMEHVNGRDIPIYTNDGWRKSIDPEDRLALENSVRNYGWRNLDELIRWRLYRRTGGGLMAELGSHQLDACSIFLGKVKPISVTAVGGKNFYNDNREIEDHVYCTFEFPGKNYDPTIPPRDGGGNCNYNDVVTVTYSSISTNGFEQYGECVMGSRGTMLVEAESSVMLFNERDPAKKGGPPRSTNVTVSAVGAGKPALEASSTWGPAGAPAGGAASASAPGAPTGPISRGYREEMEDFAYCIRMWDQAMSTDRRLPRCHGTVAMADAIIALTSNLAMKHKNRIEFQESWFSDKDEDFKSVPDAEIDPANIKD